MPYRPGIIVSGEHFVNETAGMNRRMREKMKQVPILMEYETDDALLDHARKIRQDDEKAKEHARERRAYLMFWAREKAKEIADCIKSDHDLCQQCGSCSLAHNRFKCLCSEGKRMLSPYRIAWLNNAYREHWRTWIWCVNVGYVPRQQAQSRSPKSEELSW